jgi:hypothetical protein
VRAPAVEQYKITPWTTQRVATSLPLVHGIAENLRRPPVERLSDQMS